MDKIIVMAKAEDMELEVSLYDFIDEQYRQNIPVLVCNVTPEEYNNMKEQLQWGGLNERIYDLSATKILGYNKFRYMITYNPFQKNMLISNYDFIYKTGAYVLDSDGLHYDKNARQIKNDLPLACYTNWEYKVYTTESYADVLKHYKSI